MKRYCILKIEPNGMVNLRPIAQARTLAGVAQEITRLSLLGTEFKIVDNNRMTEIRDSEYEEVLEVVTGHA